MAEVHCDSITFAVNTPALGQAARPATNPVTKRQESCSQAVLDDTIDIFRPPLSLNNFEVKGDNNIEWQMNLKFKP